MDLVFLRVGSGSYKSLSGFATPGVKGFRVGGKGGGGYQKKLGYDKDDKGGWIVDIQTGRFFA